MDSSFFGVLMLTLFMPEINNVESRNNNYILSRRKRYLVFPEGSSLSLAICMQVQTPLPDELFTEAINWGISYQLPNESSQFTNYLNPRQAIQRRHRRDLYEKMELIMNSMGYNGKECVFRALCETTEKLHGTSIIEEILLTVFRFPTGQLLHSEPEEHRLYHRAYRVGQYQDQDCSELYPRCSVSLLDMALGLYSNNIDEMSNY